MEEESPEETTFLERFWLPIIVALIGGLAVVIAALIGKSAGAPTPTPALTQSPFTYQVRVQAEDTGEYLSNARVTIEVVEQAPIGGMTDTNGLARIIIAPSHAGQPGFLIVEATGYQRHRQHIDLLEGTLPDSVALEPEP
jgi:hypothetical protein